jgi:hypothetical protein
MRTRLAIFLLPPVVAAAAIGLSAAPAAAATSWTVKPGSHLRHKPRADHHQPITSPTSRRAAGSPVPSGDLAASRGVLHSRRPQ